ncbi:hypothetical protein GGI25_004129 [Coemansia spiralis]|uniref:Uncharacterized protein n=2 Tax=Coemansia TaxID=4863 RepID=A0A9W8KXF6_9FUNG|nr:hypothetical protein BX070DRAFT_236827 [Coemansia spiralis]KAJ1990611.1 hypothetical protein EDC05_003926 [Coemansia umbellata]KAJ2622413.1 hypothetical protein GGI26_003276 [Coemansia sp. RSA 1358]KAJ2675080.1 hypothetical protein GGI25_004129 [Coemansia spiralis]
MTKIYALVSGNNGEGHFLGFDANQTMQELTKPISEVFGSPVHNSAIRLLDQFTVPFGSRNPRYIDIEASETMARCLELSGGQEPVFLEFHMTLDIMVEYQGISRLVSVPYTATVGDVVHTAFGSVSDDHMSLVWQNQVVDLCTVVGPNVSSIGNAISIVVEI